MKICPNCGQEAQEQDLFCTNCGEKLDKALNIATAPEEPAAPEAPVAAEATEATETAETAKTAEAAKTVAVFPRLLSELWQRLFFCLSVSLPLERTCFSAVWVPVRKTDF